MVIVSYIKHFDGDVKGTYTAPTNDLVQAAWMTRDELIVEAKEDGFDVEYMVPAALFTLTKAELVAE